MVIDADTNRRMLEKIRRNEQHFAWFMAFFSVGCLLFMAVDNTMGLVSGVGLTLNALIWGLRGWDP